jgi:hypothetical protein
MTVLVVAAKRSGGAGEADMVKVVEKGFDAAGGRSRGFADCLAGVNDVICHVAAGQSTFQIAHQTSLANGREDDLEGVGPVITS